MSISVLSVNSGCCNCTICLVLRTIHGVAFVFELLSKSSPMGKVVASGSRLFTKVISALPGAGIAVV